MKQVFFIKLKSHFRALYINFLADIANIEQASLCLRYVHNGMIHEKFIKFIPVHDRSGVGLANLLLKEVANLGIIAIQVFYH
jgi:hypothetical protein